MRIKCKVGYLCVCGGGGYTQWLVKTIKWNSIIMQCPLKNCSNRAFHFLHPPCSIRMHRKYMYKGFLFLKWEIHYMRLHTVKNKSIKQSINHLPTVIIHVMDSLCCLEHDRWQSAYHSMETERRLFIDYYLLLRAHFDWKLKIKGI